MAAKISSAFCHEYLWAEFRGKSTPWRNLNLTGTGNVKFSVPVLFVIFKETHPDFEISKLGGDAYVYHLD